MKSETQRDGKHIDLLGYYNPMTEPVDIKLDKERTKEWLKNGAIPSQTVENILTHEGLYNTEE